MLKYQAPLRDFRFVMHELFDYDAHLAKLDQQSDLAPQEITAAILEEAAKFCEQVLAPLNQTGDQQGCTLNDGLVTLPEGFQAAYQKYIHGGWPSLSQNPEYGGQGLPPSLGMLVKEMICSANLAWGMYPGLAEGAMQALEHHASDTLKQTYLPKLIDGSWAGTMCLTEPQCGTDLSLIKTQAQPQTDGSYQITGTKIFISAGEHQLTENILHLVLARLPKAPAGHKGISLFLVPKFLPQEDGNLGARNAVVCSGLESKMGIHANSTCVMNFDGATGFLIGQEHQGLNAMFTMMNNARLGVGIQGQGLMEVALQNSLAYAQERLQMRALTGAAYPDKPADPLIVHPDIRRMLLSQKAFSEGGRALILYAAQLVDLTERSQSTSQAEAAEMLNFITPLVKGFLTEAAFETTNQALQIFGGHGYIRANGMEQLVRDARITTIYEGTTGIQALDLLGRKVLANQGASLQKFIHQIHKYCQTASQNEQLHEFILPLIKLNKEWGELTQKLGVQTQQDPNTLGAAAHDYLMYSGYLTLAYFWAQMAQVAIQKLTEKTSETSFYQAKLATARFYFQHLLPRAQAHAAAMSNSAEVVTSLDANSFGLGFTL